MVNTDILAESVWPKSIFKVRFCKGTRKIQNPKIMKSQNEMLPDGNRQIIRQIGLRLRQSGPFGYDSNGSGHRIIKIWQKS